MTPQLIVDPVSGPLSALVALPKNRSAIIMLFGPAGQGKTSVGMLTLPDVTLVTAEMEVELARSYEARLGASIFEVLSANPKVDNDEFGRPSWHFRTPPRAIMVDSLSECGHPELVLEVVRAMNIPAVVISQVTEEGRPRGPHTLEHNVDVTVMVDRGVCYVEKNRFGSAGQVPYLLTPPAPLYYVVDGKRQYKLLSWPHECPPQSPYAGLLRKLDKNLGRGAVLPVPPAAVAATWLPLAGGWVEPADYLARAAFARQLGVPYYSPIHGVI